MADVTFGKMGGSNSWADADPDLEPIAPPPSSAPAAEPRAHVPHAREERFTDEPVIPDRPPFKAFVGNLDFSVTEEDIEDLLAPAKIIDIHMVIDRSTGRFKGFSYVEFQDQESLKVALAKNDASMFQRQIRVDVATERQGRRDGGGGGGGGAWGGRGGGGGGFGDRGRADEHRGGGGGRREHHQREPFNPDLASSAPTDKERPRLKLAPRTQPKVNQVTDATALAQPNKKEKSNPFGAARPRELVIAERKSKEAPDSKPATTEAPRESAGRGRGGRPQRGAASGGAARGGQAAGRGSKPKRRGDGGKADDDGFKAVTKGKKVPAKAQQPDKKAEKEEDVTGGAFGALALEE